MNGHLDCERMGELVFEVARDQAEWSQATFGKDGVRGPVGALMHLEKEAREAQANPKDREEYADCLLLILDAARRAGTGAFELFKAAKEKQAINRARKWPAPPAGDAPIEHIADPALTERVLSQE